MKKALVLTVVLIILSACGMVFAFADINAARDQVIITETAKFGDISAADGLEVLVRTQYDHHLFWDTTYQTDQSAARTNYRFSHTQVYENSPMEYSGVQMETAIQYGFDFASDGKQSGISAAYKELFDRTPTGTEGSATVRLKDYYEFYPIQTTLDMPGNLLSWSSDFYTDTALEPGTETYVTLAFKDFFRIPVMEDETVDISVTKNIDGSMGGYGSGSTEGDAFYLWTLSTLTDDACYFTFNPHTTKGNVIDTSLIPGGYGIYHLPYNKDHIVKDGITSGILIDELSMVYSLNPEDTVFDLRTNPDQTKLLLLTKENKVCVLTVIDTETMKPLQRLELAVLGGDESLWNTYYYDDFIALHLSENQLAVVDRKEDGEYEHRFTVNLTDDAEELYSLSRNAVMDWDGEKLVVSDFLTTNYARNMNYFKYCSFYLSVYDETGLLYFGEYLSSLDAGNELNSFSNPCQSTDYSPLSVSWID